MCICLCLFHLQSVVVGGSHKAQAEVVIVVISGAIEFKLICNYVSRRFKQETASINR